MLPSENQTNGISFSERVAQWHIRQHRRGALRYLLHAWPTLLFVIAFMTMLIGSGRPAGWTDWFVVVFLATSVIYQTAVMSALVRQTMPGPRAEGVTGVLLREWLRPIRPRHASILIVLLILWVWGAVSSGKFELLYWIPPLFVSGGVHYVHQYLVSNGFREIIAKDSNGHSQSAK